MDIMNANSLPPGFGFHPTDVELISHYLKRKNLGLKIDLEVIPEVDIYKYEPWDLPAKCHIPTRDSKWHFFTSRDRKYPNGSRANRATEAGFWKSTGKDRSIRLRHKVIGTKKTLVFHLGRPPCGKRTDWIMHEYYIEKNEFKAAPGTKEVFVLCRVTKRDCLDDENMPPKIEDDPCSKPPECAAQSVAPEKLPSPSENDDIEAWFSELYDPNFSILTTINELKSEPTEDFISSALEQELVDSFPEDVLWSDDAYNILPSNIFDFNPALFEENAGYAPRFSDGLMLDDLSPISTVGGYIGNHESSSSENTSGIFDTATSIQANEVNNAGIQRRERRTKTTEAPSHRSKLKVHKMESKNGVSVNQTVQFVNQGRHLDVNDGVQSPARVEAEGNSCITGSSDSVGSRSGSQWKLEIGKSPSVQHDGTRCILGIIKSLLVFLRRCSSVDLNCFLLGACMMGTVAVILYFLAYDASHLCGSFSTLGL